MQKNFILGSAIKSEPGGKIFGWLVRFSDGETTDLQGEYFTKNTDFGDIKRGTTVMYHHGLDPVIQDKIELPGTLKKFDEGLWVETQLDLSNKYQRAAKHLIDKGVLGWSSGAPPHLVKKKHMMTAKQKLQNGR